MALKYTSETDQNTWFWDGQKWSKFTGGGGDCCVIFSETPPENPFPSMRWFDTTSGIEYIYYDDGDSSSWVSPRL